MAFNSKGDFRDAMGRIGVSGLIWRIAGLGLVCVAVAVSVWALHVHYTSHRDPYYYVTPGTPFKEKLQYLDLPSRLTNKPQADTREYQYEKLANGLQVVNVYDPKVKTTSFAVAVEAGQLDDPESLPGLAHFCEHMLFLGSGRYPKPTGFDDFVLLHSGASNAYTAQESTVYYMTFEQSGWKEGMDRFADFFRSPLFDKQFVSKEAHAVESEHSKNKQSPGARTQHLLLALADPRSPVSKFHTGDLGTLIQDPEKQGIDTIAELRKYFSNNYCPDRMRLVTFGSDALDAQLAEAVARFGTLDGGHCPDRSLAPVAPEAWHPADAPSRMGQWVDAKGTEPQSRLWVMWALPPVEHLYKHHPLSYLEYVMNYGGENSLVRTLHDSAGLTTAGVGVYIDKISTGTTFWFSAELTSKGRDHPAAVLDLLYAYISRLRSHGVDMELFSSIAKAQQVKYNWREAITPGKAVQALADSMLRLPKEDLLTGDYLTPKPGSQQTMQMLQKLVPENMNVALVDPGYEPGKHPDKKVLLHYGVEYTIRTLADALGKAPERWTSWLNMPSDKMQPQLEQQFDSAGLSYIAPMAHPKPIQNIPKNVTLDHAQAQLGKDFTSKMYGAKPDQILLDGGGALWFRQGSTLESPMVHARFSLRSSRQSGDGITPRDDLLLNMYAGLLQKKLDPQTVDLGYAGASFKISVDHDALSLAFQGFSEIIPKLVDVVLAELNNKVDVKDEVVKARYDRIIEKARVDLSNYQGKMPFEYALADRNNVVLVGKRANEEYLAALDSLQLDDVPDVLQRLLLSKKVHHSSLVMGNIDQDGAKRLDREFTDQLPVDATLPISAVELVTAVVHPRSPIEIRKVSPKTGDPNHVTVVTLMQGVPDITSRVLLSMLGTILGKVAFQELRTARQLGYVVNGGMVSLSNIVALSVVVQGAEKQPDDVESLIELVYNKLMPDRLSSMTDDEFLEHRNGFMESLKEPPLGFSNEVAYYSGPVATGGQCIDLKAQLLDYAVRKLTSKQQLIDAWAQAMQPVGSSGMRQKIVVKYFAGSVPESPGTEEASSALRALGLDEATVNVAARERAATLRLSGGTSADRATVLADAEAKAGPGRGLFSEDLGCGSPVRGSSLLRTGARAWRRDSENTLKPEK